MFRTTLVLIAVTCLASVARAETIEPFNGKDLKGWKFKAPEDRNHWTVGAASLKEGKPNIIDVKDGGTDLINATGGGVDGYCEATFGDCTIEVEVMVPKGSNSGIYVMGEYEIQVFDSYGKENLGGGDMGAIYSAAPPRVNAQKAPGEWNKYVIDFKAPKFDSEGKRTSPATFVKVTLNGQVIHENVEMKGPTPGGITGKEHATGPVMFQGDHGPVAYRNLKIVTK